MKNILIFTTLLFCILQSKAETNQVVDHKDRYKGLAMWGSLFKVETNIFITDNSYGASESTVRTTSGFIVFRPEKIEEAKKNPESLPAKDFPQGNWGTEIGDTQLSCRFEKTTFTNGEPITAVILVRNVTLTNIVHYSPFLGAVDGPVNLVVTTENGEILPEKKYHGSILANVPRMIVPGTQHKYNERLDSGYTLTNGTYLVSAVLNWSSKENRYLNESGKAKITIVPTKPPEEPQINSSVK